MSWIGVAGNVMVLLIITKVIASNEHYTIGLCDDDPNEEISEILSKMQRTLGMFKENRDEITADVALGLVISSMFIQNCSIRNMKPLEYNNITSTMEELINGFLNGEFGDQHSSSNLIPHILNTALWERSVKPLRRLQPSANGNNIKKDGYFASEKCLEELFLENCETSNECISNVQTLEDYFATHYLLYLIVAEELSCPEKGHFLSHDELRNQQAYLCQQMYKSTYEIEQNRDVFFEETVLCGLLGYIEFARKDWRKRVLALEKNGCFQLGRRFRRTNTLTKSGCHTHPTAVAFAVLSYYLRVVSQSCYALNKNLG